MGDTAPDVQQHTPLGGTPQSGTWNNTTSTSQTYGIGTLQDTPSTRVRVEGLAHALQCLLAGEVHVRGETVGTETDVMGEDASTSAFDESTALFNAAAPLAAWLVVRPTCAEDVSTTIKFCNKHNLSPSVRSGGYSTAGWSIQGDLVMDMRSMRKVSMLPPAARYAPQYNPPCRATGSRARRRSTEMEGQQTEWQESRKLAREQTESKRRRENSEDSSKGHPGRLGRRNGRASEQDADGLLPRVKSGDSGVDADEDCSNGSNGDGTTPERNSDDAARDSPVPPTAWTASLPIVSSPSNNDSIRHTIYGSASGSGSGGDTGCATTTTAASSVDVEMSDGAQPVGAADDRLPKPDAVPLLVEESSEMLSSSASPPINDRGACFEHQRWRNFHRPATSTRHPSTSAVSNDATAPSPSALNGEPSARLLLPTTGGFIWTANSEEPGSLGTTRPLDSTDADHLGGSTLPEVNATRKHEQSERLSAVSAKSFGVVDDRSDYGSPSVHYASSGSQSDAYTKAGIHAHRYRLVEFEPGVGVRDLDVFTDRMGRNNFANTKISPELSSPLSVPSRSKGKMPVRSEPEQFDNFHADQDSNNVGNGVPYHVPLSAYPVGSTATTIGGFGYLSRAYGLSLDNIVELDLVLADGRLKRLNCLSSESDDTEERDLWWAVRGAAPCFGVVTRIVAKAYPVPRVYAGNMIYPFNPATAPSLLRHWRDCLKGTGGTVPRELYSNLIMTAGPSDEARAESVVVIQICYLGTGSSEEIGHNFVQAINSWTGERVLLKDVSEKSMLSQQDGVAQVLKSGHGKRWMVRGDLVTTLTDEVIARTVKQFSLMERGGVWLFELVAGAIEDGAEGNTTCVGKKQREAKFTAAALQEWTDRREDASCARGVEAWVKDTLATVSVGGPFASFLERNEDRSRCEGAFGQENFARLLSIKRRVDPNGVFRHTFGHGLVGFAMAKEE